MANNAQSFNGTVKLRYSDWEGEVTDLVAEALGISNSDAQAVIESQCFHMQQSWGKGMSAEVTAAKILSEDC